MGVTERETEQGWRWRDCGGEAAAVEVFGAASRANKLQKGEK